MLQQIKSALPHERSRQRQTKALSLKDEKRQMLLKSVNYEIEVKTGDLLFPRDVEANPVAHPVFITGLVSTFQVWGFDLGRGEIRLIDVWWLCKHNR